MSIVTVKGWTKKALNNAKKAAELTVQQTETAIVEATPVDTGRARQSWPPTGRYVFLRKHKFTSVLVYMKKLEYGHSQQAPKGMVRENVKLFPQRFYENVKRIRG